MASVQKDDTQNLSFEIRPHKLVDFGSPSLVLLQNTL